MTSLVPAKEASEGNGQEARENKRTDHDGNSLAQQQLQ